MEAFPLPLCRGTVAAIQPPPLAAAVLTATALAEGAPTPASTPVVAAPCSVPTVSAAASSAAVAAVADAAVF